MPSGVLLGTGYAGHGEGVNIRSSVRSQYRSLAAGCLPINPPVNTTTHGPYVMWLTPDPANEMFGRSGFGIHADEIANPGKHLRRPDAS